MADENKDKDNGEQEDKNNSKQEVPNVLEKQRCPMCMENTLTLTEAEKEIPYFGNVFLFSMNCSNCKYFKADIEAAEKKEPSKYTIDVSGDNDMKIRVVKSADATVKILRIMTITPGPASNGYVTNIEGILNRAKTMLENVRDDAEDKSERKKAKSMIKKLQDVVLGRDKIKIILDDPSGNSSIISDKAVKSKI